MKSAMEELISIIEMEHNNGVEISQRVLWKMLNEAKEKDEADRKQLIIGAYDSGKWQDLTKLDVMKKTAIKTTIKGYENLTVKENVQSIYDTLQDKHSFMSLTLVAHNGNETPIGVKKTSIKLFKQLDK